MGIALFTVDALLYTLYSVLSTFYILLSTVHSLGRRSGSVSSGPPNNMLFALATVSLAVAPPRPTAVHEERIKQIEETRAAGPLWTAKAQSRFAAEPPGTSKSL